MSDRKLWLLTSGVSFVSAMLVLLGHLMQEPTPLTEAGATLMLGLSYLTFLQWIALADPKSRRRAGINERPQHD